MKVLVAPDSFKESLSAAQVAAAMGEGVLDVVSEAVVDLCPMADGGEGTVASVVAATGGSFLTADVFGPLGSEVRARLGFVGSSAESALPGELGLVAMKAQAEGEGSPAGADGATAVIEIAAASGLLLVAPEQRDPMRTTSFGTGQLILATLDAGAREIIVGIGGSATVDGGCGCAQALGARFIDRHGRPCVCGLSGEGIGDIAMIDVSGVDPRLAEARIRVACDVSNPLTGPDGAAAVYAPQKGATAEMVERLEANLAHVAEQIRRHVGVDVEALAGAGAAGGLGAALVAFAGATLAEGAPLIAEVVHFGRRVEDADLCLTGEGCLDRTSRFGKTPLAVAKLAQEAGVRTVCIPGQVTDDAPTDAFEAVCPLAAGEIEPREALRRPEELLRMRAARAVMDFLDKA